MKPLVVVAVLVALLGVATAAFWFGSQKGRAANAPGPLKVIPQRFKCDDVLNTALLGLGPGIDLKPCSGKVPGGEVLGKMFGMSIPEMNYSKGSTSTVNCVVGVGVYEYDLSISSGRDGLRKNLADGYMGIPFHKVGENVLVILIDSPGEMLRIGARDPQSAAKLAAEMKVPESVIAWLRDASDAQIAAERERIKAQVYKNLNIHP